jgi:cbb3-type cytochrome oxidase maturation protein
MTALAWLVPIALLLGGLGLATFLWALRSGQFEDLQGAAYRALEDDPPEDAKSVAAFAGDSVTHGEAAGDADA